MDLGNVPATLAALQEASRTLQESTVLLDSLLPRGKAAPESGPMEADFTMTPRHAIELHRYLDAYRQGLQEWHDKVAAFPTGPQDSGAPAPFVQILATHRFEFESALHFVQEAFVKPRQDPDNGLVLKVADWLCVDGFQLFVSRNADDATQYPLGPLVALDPERSPAMWDDDTDLTIPSLFDLTAKIHRGAESSTGGLAVFPVITLPADLSHLPEYYALLSHEVGHAVDAAFGFTTRILDGLKESRHLVYWTAWMREIVADATGVTLSGEAFVLAWWRFVRPMSPQTDLTYSDPYPPFSLRLAFLRGMLAIRGNLTPAVPVSLPEETPLKHQYFVELKEDFASQVLPLLQQIIFSAVPLPGENETFVRASAGEAVKDEPIDWAQKEFRLLPSILTLAITEQDSFKTWEKLPGWLDDFRTRNQTGPGWQSQTSSNWKFGKEFLPTLRPTILGPDGVTKLPPRVLMLTHRRIAFLGATQRDLLAALDATSHLRDEPWERLDIYFASDALLESVEYYNAAGFRRATATLIVERDQALAALREFFGKNPGCCRQVNFLIFDGPPVFASYWDWDQPGGRIHISAQLAGIDLGKCPALDYMWLHDTPTFIYDQYRSYLRTLEARARAI